MRCIALTNKGIEDVAASEIKDVLGLDAEAADSIVFFDAKNFEDIFRACYRLQSARKIILLLKEFRAKKMEDIHAAVKNAGLEDWLNSSSSFVVRSIAENPGFDRQEIESETGAFILESHSAKVDLKNPGVTFFVLIEGEKGYFGIDFSGEDLGKRDYRIFAGSEALKPNVAFSLLGISGFKEGETLLDPFCSAGTIPIEAALSCSRISPRKFSKDRLLFCTMEKFRGFDFNAFFDAEDSREVEKPSSRIVAADASFQGISSAKKNSKIAGINKAIEFSRKEPSWLDAKFKEGEVSMIVTFPPLKGRALGEKQVEKIYTELFYQAEFILNKKGSVLLLLNETGIAEASAAKYGFAAAEKREIMQGKMKLVAVVFTRQNPSSK